MIDKSCYAGIRIDRFLAEGVRLFTRSQLKIRITKVLLNGKESRLGKRLSRGDTLSVFFTQPPVTDVKPEAIALEVLFENEHVLVIDKPCGMVVHPAKGNYTGTLVNALLYYCKDLIRRFPDEGGDGKHSVFDEYRPGIVHRLDKDTSGVLITAKNSDAQSVLSEQFKSREVRKVYLAVVKGRPKEKKGRIDKVLARGRADRKKFTCAAQKGKRAVTDYRVLQYYRGYSLVKIMPRTGRTHQIRVHMKSIGCPVLGDSLYSRRDAGFPDIPLMLHAYQLHIRLPGEEKSRRFRAPLPRRFRELLRTIKRAPRGSGQSKA